VTGAYIKVAYFENDADILYQDEIHGPLILQVEKTMELIYTKYMKALISYEGIYRKETFFFPKSAFRELLLNAVIHKDYLSTTPIQIRIYKDKIRLWNDGALPKEVPVEDLFKEHVSKPCNPNLANVFFKCGMIESWARGFNKITRYCEEENAKLPVIDLSLGGVTARCYASDGYLALMNEYEKTEKFTENDQKSGQKTVEKTREKNCGENQKTVEKTREKNCGENQETVEKNCGENRKTVEKILSIINENPFVTQKQLIDATGLSRRGVEWQLKQLKEKGLIRRIGADKGGHWEIVEK
jgi:ATP-dependent DNA helicase RecG